MARSFNGTSDYISTGLKITHSNGTLACRFRISSAPSANDVYVGQNATGDGTLGLGFQAQLGNLVGYVNNNSSGSAGAILTDSSEQTFVLTWGSAGIKCYLNAGTAATNAHTGAPTANAAAHGIMEIGAFNYSGGRLLFPPIAGAADFAIWDEALGADEVAAYHKGFSPLLIRSHALTNYCRILGNDSPEPDIVGGGTFTVTGAAKADHQRVFMPYPPKAFPIPAAAAATGQPYVKRIGGVRGMERHIGSGVRIW